MYLYFKEILYILGDDKKRVPVILFLFILLSLLEVVSLGLIAPYIALVVDAKSALDGDLGRIVKLVGLPNDTEQLLLYLGGILLFVFLIKTILIIWVNSVIVFFSNDQQVRLSSILMKAYQSLDYVRYLERNSSEYIHGINNLSSQFSSVLLLLLRSISNIFVSTIIIMLLVWQAPLELLLLIAIIFLFTYGYNSIFKEKIYSYGKKTNKYSNDMLRGIHEGMEGFKEVRILGKESYFHKILYNGSKNHAFYNSKSQIISTMPRYILELLMIIFIVLLVVGSTIFGGDLKTLAPVLAVFGVAALKLLPAASTLSNTLTQLHYSRHSISILYNDVKKFNKDVIVNKHLNFNNTRFRSLKLDRVSFSYPGSSDKALRSISLEINAGESIGFMGKSGSGKTTLIDVILGLLNSESGSVYYNGKDLKKKSVLSDWLSQVAYLPQQVFLIDDTLKCNVALGVDEIDIDDKKVLKSLKQSSMLEFMNGLSKGIHTKIGERGVKLSGGQRQRIALSRAFYHGRNVLIMDESTSALDNETEKEVVEELKQLKKDKITTVVIAHRLSTLQYCDRIYELSKGEVVNMGSYKEVTQRFKKVTTSKI